MDTGKHTEADEAHLYVVRSSAAEHLTVNQDCAGSNPVAPPTVCFEVGKYVGDSFMLPGAAASGGEVIPR